MHLSAVVKQKLYEALEQRHTEVADMVGRENPIMPQMPTPAAEEILRILMTRYFPKFPQYESETLALMKQLAPFSLSNDLRFLDAFNNFYDSGFRHSDFLGLYSSILRSHLKEQKPCVS